ncbi:amidohydrolase family protein [Trinickia fusca]|uniref:Amidohydrolase-related domain-containing protein n=1 Tax=Trinickia fusca TaxID=2419777 RepID=A0A494XEA8_9BURK|nr:amidohydrolase family protein [Trinickia fusca]RKP49085.1 hypothetical protein D7S89_09770 [Trinickia fusca]
MNAREHPAAAMRCAQHTTITGIDTHAHVFARASVFAEQPRYRPASDALLADFLARLDAHGLSHGVLVQPSFLGTDNSYLLRAIAAAPGRLRGIAVVDPHVVAAHPELLDALARSGIVGIRINVLKMADPEYDHPAWRATLRKVAQLHWCVQVHCEARRLPRIVAPLLAYGVDVVVDHFGRPEPTLGIADEGLRYLLTLGATRRVWVKISAAYRNGIGDAASLQTALAALTLLRDAFGLDRLVWGSDWPHTQFEQQLTYEDTHCVMRTLLSSEHERQVVLVDTPAALFKFG